MISFIQTDVGGTLVYYVSDNRPIDSGNTPTVTLYSASGAELVASQNATKGPTTTLDGSAASGQKTIPLTATTSITSGEQYRIGPNASGQWEIVTVDTVSSGVSVAVRDNLLYTYATSNVFQSQKVTVAVSSSQADTSQINCRAVWSFQSSSANYAETSIFHISKYAPVNTVTSQDLLKLQPKADKWISSRGKLEEIIDSTYNSYVLADLTKILEPTGIISGEQLATATINRTLASLALQNEKHELYDAYMLEYKSALEQVITSTPFDEDSDGDTTDEPARHPWSLKVLRS